MKLTSFAYNLYDGTYDYAKVFKTDHGDEYSTKLYRGLHGYFYTNISTRVLIHASLELQNALVLP